MLTGALVTFDGQPFHAREGDRVRLKVPLCGAPAGTSGEVTAVEAWPGRAPSYELALDGRAGRVSAARGDFDITGNGT